MIYQNPFVLAYQHSELVVTYTSVVVIYQCTFVETYQQPHAILGVEKNNVEANYENTLEISNDA